MGKTLETVRNGFLPLCSIVVLGALVSCGPGDPGSGTEKKALETYTELTSNPQVRVYALQLAADSTSPTSGALLVEGTSARGYDIALESLRGLGKREVPGGREALQVAFDEKRGGLKAVAALGLAKQGDETARQWLVQQVQDGLIVPGQEVLVFFAESGEQELAKSILEKWTKSKDETTRDEAYAILGSVGEPWATLILLQGMEKEHGLRRKEAVIALGNTGDAEVSSRVAKFVNTQGLVFVSLEALGKIGNADAAPTVEKSVGHEEELVRAYSGAALWKLGGAETARETVAPLVQSEDEVVRRNLAEQLGTVNTPEATEILTALAADPAKDVRRSALLSLLDGGDASLVPLFVERTQDPEYEVATVALDGVGKWGGATDLPALEPLLVNENPYVALAAANAILEIRTRTAPSGA